MSMLTIRMPKLMNSVDMSRVNMLLRSASLDMKFVIVRMPKTVVRMIVVTKYSSGTLKIAGMTTKGLAAITESFMATARNAIGK